EEIESGTYLVYDRACGTGGMLTVAEETLREIAREHEQEVAIHLYGQEVNPETFAITKADLLLKGEGADADNMRFGSTLAADGFPGRSFDFMLSNPPYGKSWKKDLDLMGGKDGMRDPRFVVQHGGEELSLVTRTSDGQMLFLVNMVQKMKHETRLGSRIAEVHNGSALFTGDAGQGESNIRRWLIENDWLEAIVALPLNIFYNTGIATYIWVLTNRKPAHRRGKAQLIDATGWYRPLRRNLGKKNCELSPEDIRRIRDIYLAFEETEQSEIFPNEAAVPGGLPGAEGRGAGGVGGPGGAADRAGAASGLGRVRGGGVGERQQVDSGAEEAAHGRTRGAGRSGDAGGPSKIASERGIGRRGVVVGAIRDPERWTGLDRGVRTRSGTAGHGADLVSRTGRDHGVHRAGGAAIRVGRLDRRGEDGGGV
ncbi:MAG TPA: class I SAM-dependent DNA methyltransferase, partial [Thermomicrobiales bacterium]|nr:class I SAM-dependent DNA methyltransferase [Thermomicrobiales bacterium]